MQWVKTSFTLCFAEPFWMGLYERWDNDGYAVAKVTFGAEPKLGEIHQLLLHPKNTFHFTPHLAAEATEIKIINPKRQQRMIQKQMQRASLSTKAQEALKMQRQLAKDSRQKQCKQSKQQQQEERFVKIQTKRKAKHRGH